MLNNPTTYEILRPEDFGLKRYIQIASRLTGWNAIRSRADQLGLNMDEATLKRITEEVKNLADQQQLTLDEVDHLLYAAHDNSPISEVVANTVPSNGNGA